MTEHREHDRLPPHIARAPIDRDAAFAAFPHPHLLGVDDLSKEAILAVLDIADRHADLNAVHEPPLQRSLRDKTLINLFFENSTRTQASFELAAKRLGATTMNMAVSRSSIAKGETLLDTATTLNAMLPDILVVRHPSSGAVRLLAERMNCAVVNAGDGRCEHPTQALLDALTMRRAFRVRRGADSPAARLEDLTVAICGDVAHSRVARSNIFLLSRFGARIRVAGPPSLAPPELEGLGVVRCASMAEAIRDADVVMMLRLQRERMDSAHIPSLRAYYHAYGLDDAELSGAAEDAIVMHPGPMNRGVEIDSELADDRGRSVIASQVEMGVAARMAVLEMVAANLPHRARARRGETPGRPPGAFLIGDPHRPPAGARGAPRPLALVGARLIDPEALTEEPGAIVVAGGRIRDVIRDERASSEAGAFGDAEVVDCAGAALAPGVVDAWVFIGEPGARHRESIASGGEAAVAGGVTTIVTQPATDPPVDDPALLDFIAERARAEGETHAMPRVRTMAALTKGLLGEQMSEFRFLRDAGAVALTDGGRPVVDALVLRRCFETAAAEDMLVSCSAVEPHLTSGACATESGTAFRMGLPAAPAMAEAMALDRDLALARLTGVRYHAAMVSTAGALTALRRARAEGVDASAAVAAPHLLMSEADIAGYRTFAKLEPPLRAETDRAALIAGLAEGVIDMLVSGHMPLSEESKRVPFEEAAAGGVGLETLLSAGLEAATEAGLSLPALFRLLSLNPSRRLDLAGGRLAVGAPADLVLFHPDRPRTIDRRTLRSKSKNSPFDRREMRGVVLKTYVRGRLAYRGAT